MEEQALNLREWLTVLRRQGRVILLFVLLGVGSAVAYVVAEPALLTAKALVLLPASPLDSTGQPLRDIGTEAQIAMSPGILDRAGEHVRPPLGFSVLQHRVTVVGLTTDILQITAKGTTSAQAEQLANGVATGFVAYTAESAARLPSVALSLQQEAAQIQRQISDLQTEINTTTHAVAGERSGSDQAKSQISLLTSLEEQQQNASLQLDSVNSQIAQTKLSESSGGTGTTVLNRAVTATGPWPGRPVFIGLLGALAGLLVGALVAVRLSRRDRKLRRRDDMAEVVGAPVVASVVLRPRTETLDWIELFRRWEPGIEDGWTMRKMLRGLAAGSGSSDVAVVALAGDDAALVLAPQLATSAASIGIPTTFVDASGEESTSSLRRASVSLGAESVPARPGLRISILGDTPAPEKTGFTVSAVVLDPREPRWPVADRPHATWLVLSSGFATAEELATVSVAAADRHQPIVGIVVVNADPGDPTTGRFPPGADDIDLPPPGRVMSSVKDVTR